MAAVTELYFEDASGQAKVEATQSRLTITSGRNEMRSDDTLGRIPRIVREVTGDFDVQVRVLGDFTKGYQQGVLLAYANPKEYFRVKSGIGRYDVKEVGTGTSFNDPVKIMLLVHNRARTPLKVISEDFEIRREGGIFSFGLPSGICWVEFKQSKFRPTELDKVSFALTRLAVADVRIGLGESTLDESRSFNTNDLCGDLLEGRLLEISERKGSGKPALFVGTNFDIGDRVIMVLVDGEPVLDVRESCLFTGFPETDAESQLADGSVKLTINVNAS
jgi:hypothetical protein